MAPSDISSMPLPEPEIFVDVAIAGAGLGGLALAVGLQERGFKSVILFEAVPYSRSHTGTVFGISPNGVTALEGLKPGLGDAVIRCGSTITQMRLVSRENPERTESASATASSGGNSSSGGFTSNDTATNGAGENSDGWVVKKMPRNLTIVGWARAQEELASSLVTRPEIIMHGHRVVAYYPVVAGVPIANRGAESGSTNGGAGEGEVEAVDVVLEVVGSNLETTGAVQIQHQLVVRAKILVAADGLRSAVRNQMIGDSPRYLEQIGWNALVPNPPSARVYPQEDQELLYYMDEVMGYQLFLIDIGHGKTFWQVRVIDPDSKLKPELKLTPFGGFGKPGVKDRLMCHVSKNIADPSGHDIWHTVLQAVTTTDPGNIYERWMMDRPPPKDSWSDPKCGNRVVLMGDAAHAMHTGPGQGAQMAFEDAHQLSMCLADVKDVLAEPAAVAAAVREYEARRIDRCVRVHGYATATHGFGEEGKFVKALSPSEKMKRFMEFRSWVHAYPDKIKGDPESTHFK